MDTAKIIKKWYKTLNFSSKYDLEFYNALEEIKIEDFKADTLDINCEDGAKNFLSCLYLCEELSQKYKEKGISEKIFFDTISDISRWLDIWSEIKGNLYLGQLSWLTNHLNMNLFKLGRLQFAFGRAMCDIAEKNIKKGDNVIEVHIPADGALLKEECEKSFELAKGFFKKFYPEYKYRYFTCYSWLMDKSLKEILNSDSNMLTFQNMFELFCESESYSILRYVFRWDATKENLNLYTPTSSFAKKVKDRVDSGEKFYMALGVAEIKE